jgi:1-acyl-sn-glycerol-3-phosphate acyltransferase
MKQKEEMNPKEPAEPYVPDLDIKYPDQPDGRMVKFKIVHDIKIDENYQFLDKSLRFKIMRFLTYLTIFVPGPIMSRLRYDFRIEGRKNLRKYRELLKNGAMTVCNHVQRWDFLFVMMAVRYRMVYFPVWKEQLKGPDKNLIRQAGGIPIPDTIQTMKYFNQAFDELRARKKWIHAFPETSRFDWFQPIRPFKKGVFTMAHRYNLPVLPMAISWRPPRRFTLDNILRTLQGKKKLPSITIRMGEPLLFDETLSRKESIQKMRKDCHEAVVRLAGISNNPYPAEGD